MLIKATTFYNGFERLENVLIEIKDNKIVDISKNIKSAGCDFEGVVTPAFIDAHNHIGMFREGEPSSESEGNEQLNQFQILNDPINSIYTDDESFKNAVDFGVLYSCVVPGSGNLIGGKAKIIRNFANSVLDIEVKDYGYKMALGFNPRSTTSWKGERPNTRMGAYALLEKKFDEILKKRDSEKLKYEKALYQLNRKNISQKNKEIEKDFLKREYELAFSDEEKEFLKLLNGEKIAKVHVHKIDDVIYLINLKKRYNIRVTAEHTSDVFNKEIFNLLRDNGIDIVYGPIGSLGYKTELKNYSYKNVKALMDSYANYALMTDHPVINVHNLRDLLKYFLIYGMSELEALKLITIKSAKILKIDNILGSLEVGKWASLIIWDKDPFYLGAFPKVVIGEGKILKNEK